jgi:glucan phosphorylase
MVTAQSAFDRADAKRVYYLSMEFLVARSLDNNLANLELTQQCREMLNRRGIDLDRILEYEPDPALGNGGSGVSRLIPALPRSIWRRRCC